MADNEEQPTVIIDSVAYGDGAGDELDSNISITERLRQRKKEVTANRTFDLDIPGYNGELFARYRLLEGREIDAIVKKVRSNIPDRAARAQAAAIDQLVLACEEFYVRDEGKEIPIREMPGFESEIPVKYDVKLAEFLDFTDELSEARRAREIVLSVFGGNDLAMTAHTAVLAQWMMQMGTQADFELGEL